MPLFWNTFCVSTPCLICVQRLPCEALTADHLHIHFGPQTSNSSLLLGSKMHHGVWELTGDPNGPEASLCRCFTAWPFIPHLLPQALPSPNKMRLLVKGRWSLPGVGLGQGWVSKMDICVSDSVGGSIRDTLLSSPLPSTVQFISQGPRHPS